MPLRVQVYDEPDGTRAAAWAAGCFVVSGENHCCTGLVPAVSAAVMAGLLSASCLLHSLVHCTESEAPRAPGAVVRPCAFSLSIQPTTISPSLCQSAR
jgi:hypothetical protein